MQGHLEMVLPPTPSSPTLPATLPLLSKSIAVELCGLFEGNQTRQERQCWQDCDTVWFAVFVFLSKSPFASLQAGKYTLPRSVQVMKFYICSSVYSPHRKDSGGNGCVVTLKHTGCYAYCAFSVWSRRISPQYTCVFHVEFVAARSGFGDYQMVLVQ